MKLQNPPSSLSTGDEEVSEGVYSSDDSLVADIRFLDLLTGLYDPGSEGFENPPLWVNAWNGSNYFYNDYGSGSKLGEGSVDPMEVVEVKHEVDTEVELQSSWTFRGVYLDIALRTSPDCYRRMTGNPRVSDI